MQNYKILSNNQIEKMAAVVMALFSDTLNIEIGTMREMFFAYVSSEELITDGTEDWPELLIDNFNGAGYKNTRGGVIKCYNDILTDLMEKQMRLELED